MLSTIYHRTFFPFYFSTLKNCLMKSLEIEHVTIFISPFYYWIILILLLKECNMLYCWWIEIIFPRYQFDKVSEFLGH